MVWPWLALAIVVICLARCMWVLNGLLDENMGYRERRLRGQKLVLAGVWMQWSVALVILLMPRAMPSNLVSVFALLLMGGVQAYGVRISRRNQDWLSLFQARPGRREKQNDSLPIIGE